MVVVLHRGVEYRVKLDENGEIGDIYSIEYNRIYSTIAWTSLAVFIIAVTYDWVMGIVDWVRGVSRLTKKDASGFFLMEGFTRANIIRTLITVVALIAVYVSFSLYQSSQTDTKLNDDEKTELLEDDEFIDRVKRARRSKERRKDIEDESSTA